ncbi:MAG: PBP1A family penicillin-binding protein [Xanthobacteraceae bacterium]
MEPGADQNERGGSQSVAAAAQLGHALAQDFGALSGRASNLSRRLGRGAAALLARQHSQLMMPPAPHRSPPGRAARVVRRLILATSLLILLAAVAAGGAMLWTLQGLPLRVDLARPAQPSLLLETASGQPLGRVGPLNGERAERGDFPDTLVNAVLSIEDRRFFDHSGIDVRGIARALYANLSAGEIVEGGSTITQQLAKMQIVGNERTLTRKLREAFTALWLELRLGKDEILTRYLNSIYLGGGAHGMSAAAHLYFDKDASQLTLAEAAMLAGLIKAPSYYNPLRNLDVAQERAAVVLDAMVQAKAIDADAAAKAKAKPATLRLSPQTARSGTWFAQWIAHHELPKIAGSGARSMRVRTTLRLDMQRLAQKVVTNMLDGSGARRNATQAALVAMRPDGAVLAMVGGRDYDESQFNRAVEARRQPGSAFKLFVFLAALRAGYAPHDSIDAGPIEIKGWEPDNYGGRQYGQVTLATAFANSLNTAAVRLATEVGLDKVVAAARDLGLDAPLMQVPSLALGTNEVNLLDLTGAFASVRAGRRLEPWGIGAFGLEGQALRALGTPTGIGQSLRFQREMVELLRGVVDHGTGRAASMPGLAAGKTGTSQDYRDAWFVGFTKELVVGVWVGNDDRSPMKGVTGGSLPARIWKRFVREATPLLDRPDVPVLASGRDDEAQAQDAAPASCDVAACENAYRSFRASDCTYQPYRGRRRLCEKTGSATSDRRNSGDGGSDTEAAWFFPFTAASADRAEATTPFMQVAADKPAPQCNIDRCAANYRSFDASDCTYQPYGGGPRRLCER